MGQNFVTESHDPGYRKAEGQKQGRLSDDEAKRLFDAAIAELDAQEAPPSS